MASKLASMVLIKYLGEFVEGLNEENVSVSILSGEFEMKNPALKKAALDSLELPITVQTGFIGSLKLSLPWTSLSSKPVVLKIENIYLLAGPKRLDQYDEKNKEERLQATKQRMLQLAEMLHDSDDKPAKVESNSWLNSTFSTIANNIQVEISNVHIRYQDFDGEGKPFSIGITLDRLLCQSTDNKWKYCFLPAEAGKTLYKIVELNYFSIYWDHFSPHIEYTDNKNLANDLQNLIYKGTNIVNANIEKYYILKPVSTEIKLKLNKGALAEKTVVDCVCDNISFRLDEVQYCQIISFTEIMRNYSKSIPYIKYRPTCSVESDPRKWWLFAARAMKADLQRKSKLMNWNYITKFIADRSRYIFLYCKKKIGSNEKIFALKPDEVEELDELERKYTYEELLRFRSYGHAYFIKNKEFIESEKKSNDNKGGFWSKLTRSKANQPTLHLIPITPDLLHELEEIIDRKAEDAPVAPQIAEVIQQKLEFKLRNGQFEIQNQEKLGILFAGFTELDILVEKKAKAILFTGSLGQVFANDFYTPNSNFIEIIRSVAQDSKIGIVKFEMDPGAAITHQLSATMRAINITLPKLLLKRLYTYFSTPLLNNQSIKDLELQATLKFDELKKKTQSQFEEIIQEKKMNLAVNIDITAPNIIIPQQPHNLQSPVLLLSLGHLVFKSTDRDPADATAFMFENFNLKLTDIYAIMINGEQSRSPLDSLPKSLKLMDNFDVELLLRFCKSNSEELELLSISGILPELNGYFNSRKATDLLLILDSLSDPPSPSQSPQISAEENSFDILLENVAKNAKKKGEIKINTNQQQVKGKFSIPKIRVLFENDREDNQPLIELQLRSMEAEFSKSTHDTKLFASLHDAYLLDHIQKTGESGKYLISSSKEEGKGGGLVELRYEGTPKSSPKFSTVVHNVNIYSNSVKIMINLPTILKLLKIMNFVLDDFNAITNQIKIAEKTKEIESKNEKNQKNIDQVPFSPQEKRKEREIYSLFKIEAKLESLVVILPSKEGHLVQIDIKTSEIKGKLTSKDVLLLEGALGATFVDYFYKDVNKHLNLLLLDNQSSVIEFTLLLKLANHPPEQSLSILDPDSLAFLNSYFPKISADASMNVTTFVNAKINSLQFIYLQKFFDELVDYFTTYIKEATSTTKKNVENEKEEVGNIKKRLKYNLIIDQPYILLPRGYSNDFEAVEGIKGTLGKILVSNDFLFNSTPPSGVPEEFRTSLHSSLSSVPTSSWNSLVKERINIFISNCNLRSGYLFNSCYDRDILTNTNLILQINQMEKVEKPMHPNFEVKVGSPQIQVQLTEYQVELIMSILENNINAPYASLQQAVAESPKPHHLNHFEESSKQTQEQLTEQESKEKNKRVEIEVKVDIKKIVAELYIGDGFTPEGKLSVFDEFEPSKRPLKQITEQENGGCCKLLSGNCISLNTNVYLYDNNTMDCNLTIETFNLIDSRPNSQAANLFPTVFSTCHSSSENPGFSLVYQQKIGNIQECKISVNKPNLISVPDIYVDSLIFILPFTDKIIYSIDIFNQFWSIFSKKLEGISVTSAQQKKAPGTMIVFYSMRNANMFVVRDPTKIDSEAVVFHSHINVIYKTNSFGDQTTVKLEQIGASKCKMDLKSEFTPFIFPYDIILKYNTSKTVKEDGEIRIKNEFDCSMSDIEAILSIVDVDSMMKMQQLWTKEFARYKPQPTIQQQLQQKKKNSTPHVKMLTNDPPQEDENYLNVNFMMTNSKIILTQLAYNNSTNRPLLTSNLNELRIITHNRGNDIKRAFFDMKGSVDYFSSKVDTWEPLVEDFSFKVEYTSSKSNNNNGFICHVFSDKILFNINQSFLAPLYRTYLDYQALQANDQLVLNQIYNPSVKSPFIILNQTGIQVSYQTSEPNSPLRFLPPNSLEDLLFANGKPATGASLGKLQELSLITLNIQLHDGRFNYIDSGLPIDRQGYYKLNVLTSRSYSNQERLATFEVQSNDSFKLIKIRSNILIRNQTKKNFTLSFESSDVKLTEIELPGNETIPVPISYVFNGKLTFKTAKQTFVKPVELGRLKNLENQTIIISCKDRVKTTFLHLFVEHKHKHDIIVHVHPAMIFNNGLPVSVKLLFQDNAGAKSILPIKAGAIKHIKIVDTTKTPILFGFDLPFYGRAKAVTIRSFVNNAESVTVEGPNGELGVNLKLETNGHSIKTMTLFCDLWMKNNTGTKLYYRPSTTFGNKRFSPNANDVGGEFIYSPLGKIHNTSKLLFQVSETADTSNLVTFEKEGIQTQLNVPGEIFKKDNKEYKRINLFVVSIKNGPNNYWRTKYATVTPRFVIKNYSLSPIYYRQNNNGWVDQVAIGSASPVQLSYLEQNQASLSLSFNIDYEKYYWTHPLPLDLFGIHSLKVRWKGSDSLLDFPATFHILSFSFVLDTDTGTTTITIRNAADNIRNPELKPNYQFSEPDYIIENHTPYPLFVNQLEALPKDYLLPMEISKVGLHFAWDHVKDNKKKIQFCSENDLNQISRQNVGQNSPSPARRALQAISIDTFATSTFSTDGKLFEVTIGLKGISKVIKIHETRSDEMVILGKEDSSLSKEASLQGIVELSIPEIGISIINKFPKELVYIHLKLVAVFSFSETKQSINVSVSEYMISNQLFNPNYPVLVYFTPDNANPYSLELVVVRKLFANQKEIEDLPKNNDIDDNLDAKHFSMLSAPPPAPPPPKAADPIILEECRVSMGEIVIKLEEELTNHLIKFISELQQTIAIGTSKKPNEENNSEIVESSPSLISIEHFSIGTLRVNLTFKLNSSESEEFITMIPNFLRLFCNLEDFRLNFDEFSESYPEFLPIGSILSELMIFYNSKSMAIYFIKFLGSAELLGSPVILFRSVGTGFHDLIMEPVSEMKSLNPINIGIGVAKGAGSFAAHTASGILGAGSKTAKSIGSGLSSLSLDDKYQAERNKETAPVKNIGQGARSSFKRFGKGVLSGVTGIVTQPIESVKKDGISGIFSGVVKGTTGVVIKPASALADSIGNVTEGIASTIRDSSNDLQRKRLPRYIGPDKIIRPFDDKLATGQNIFKSLDTSFEHEWLQNVFFVKNGYIIVSDKNILFATQANNSIVWKYPSRAVRGLQLGHTYILLVTVAGEVKYIYPEAKGTPPKEIYDNLIICLDKCRNDRHFKQL